MKRHHLIYFLARGDGLMKIGTTSDLQTRLHDLSKQHGPLRVVRVINGDQKREKAIHHDFRAFREFGEWFRNPGGDLERLVSALADGESVAVETSAARKDWIAGELRLVDDLRETISAALEVRCQYTGSRQEAAVAALSEQYGFPRNFLKHLMSGRAVTVSAFGWQRVHAAYMAEMRAAMAHYNAEIDRLKDDVSDEEIFAIGERVAALAEKIAARKARLK